MPHALEVTLVALTSIAAFTDVRSGKIPNWLTLPWLALGPVAHLVHAGLIGLAHSVLGLLLCASVPLLLRKASKNAMGGGDLKLFAALGALAGPLLGMQIQIYSYLFLAFYGLSVLAYRGRLFAVLANAFWLVAGRFRPAEQRRTVAPEALTQMRMGAAILAACLLTVAAQRLEVGP